MNQNVIVELVMIVIVCYTDLYYFYFNYCDRYFFLKDKNKTRLDFHLLQNSTGSVGCSTLVYVIHFFVYFGNQMLKESTWIINLVRTLRLHILLPLTWFTELRKRFKTDLQISSFLNCTSKRDLVYLIRQLDAITRHQNRRSINTSAASVTSLVFIAIR